MNASRNALQVTLVCLMLVTGCNCPQPSRDDDYTVGAQEFDAAAAQAHVKYLASDALQGRLVGTPGSRNASMYIAERFAEYGLLPIAMLESYYQTFRSPVTLTLAQPALAIVDLDGRPVKEFTVQVQFIPRTGRFLGSGDVTGQVVWLGGCLPRYFNASLAGRIVLCAPMSSDAREKAVLAALYYGISGILEKTEDDGPYLRSAYGWCELIDMPAFTLSREVISDLLAGSPYGLDDLNELEVPALLGINVRMTASFERTEVEARNVLGVLPGSDPLLRDEVVIIGAHYDGPGTDPDGTIYNGANDNASGVAVVLEIARLWHAQGVRPARTVLFAAWDGEEQIVQGSNHYVADPLYPLDRTVAYLNLDAVGVGEVVSIYEERIESDQHNILADRLQAGAELFDIDYHIKPDRLSDDMSFYQNGVTAAGLMVVLSSLEMYPQLHMSGDDPEIIQDDTLQKVGILSAHALFAWAAGR